MIKSTIEISKENHSNDNFNYIFKNENIMTQYVNIYLAKKKENNDDKCDNNNNHYNFFDKNNLFILLDIKNIYINIKSFHFVLNDCYLNNDSYNDKNLINDFNDLIHFNDNEYLVKFLFVKINYNINKVKVLIIINEDYYNLFIKENNLINDINDISEINCYNNKTSIKNNEFIKSIIVKFIVIFLLLILVFLII
jgi:hypothetical protein